MIRMLRRGSYVIGKPVLWKSFSSAPVDLDEMVIVTTSCGQRIKQLQAKQGKDSLYLRLFVEGGGCSGYSYKFNLEDEPLDPEDDKVFERDGSKVVVDSESFKLVKGATVDYVQEMMKSAFAVVNNPQSASSCGCGSSFAVKNFAANPALD